MDPRWRRSGGGNRYDNWRLNHDGHRLAIPHRSGVTRRAFKGRSTTSPKDSKAPSIEVLEATEGKPVRFRINDPPSSGSAWVGIYPFGAEDEDHGEEGERWNWLRDIDASDASFPARRKGSVSIRVFSDGGYTLHSREDFDISPSSKKWWEE